MTALYGSIGTGTAADAAEALAAMAGPSELPHRVEQRGAAGHLAIGVAADGALHADERCVVAMVGRPRLGAVTAIADVAAQFAAAFTGSGSAAVRELRGSFACVAHDLRTGRTLLAVDRMGTQPLALSTATGNAVFGSSAGAVARVPGFPTALDPQAVFNYFYFHMIPSPRTVFAGIRKLEPAEAVEIDGQATRSERYWNPAFGHADHADKAALQTETHSALRDAVARCLDGRPVGAFLSGGIDSSTVVGMLREIRNEPPRAFSIGFDEKRYDELEFARITARRFGARLTEYHVTPADVVAGVHEVAAACDEPFGNSSILPAYYCARVAKREGIELLLAGDGGDEIFAGNERYAKNVLFERYHAAPAPLRKALEYALFATPRLERVTLLRKARRYVSIANTPLPDRLQDYNYLHRTPLAEIFAAPFLERVDAAEPIAILRDTYAQARSSYVVDRMMFLDWKFTLADNDLRKVNTACKTAGVGVAYPFLDDDVVEVAARVPGPWKLEGRRLRAFFKDSMRGFLPDEVLHKQKHGFGLPFGEWLRRDGELNELARGCAHGFAERGVIRPEYVERLLRAHAAEHAAYYGTMIWLIMVLELWLRAHASRAARDQ